MSIDSTTAARAGQDGTDNKPSKAPLAALAAVVESVEILLPISREPLLGRDVAGLNGQVKA